MLLFLTNAPIIRVEKNASYTVNHILFDVIQFKCTGLWMYCIFLALKVRLQIQFVHILSIISLFFCSELHANCPKNGPEAD